MVGERIDKRYFCLVNCLKKLIIDYSYPPPPFTCRLCFVKQTKKLVRITVSSSKSVTREPILNKENQNNQTASRYSVNNIDVNKTHIFCPTTNPTKPPNDGTRLACDTAAVANYVTKNV